MSDVSNGATRGGFSVVSLAAVVGIVVVGIWLAEAGRALLIPPVVAVILWFFLMALADFYRNLALRKWRMPRWLAMVAALLTYLGIGYVLVEVLRGSVTEIVGRLPFYQHRLDQVLARLSGSLHLRQDLTLTGLMGKVELSVLAGWAADGLATLGRYALEIGLYLLFFSLEARHFRHKLDVVFPDPSRRAEVQGALDRIGADLQTYVWIKSALGLLVAFLTWLTLSVAGLPFPIFWATIAFLLSYIPTVGSVVGVSLPCLFALVHFDTFVPFLGITAALVTVRTVVGDFLEPRLMGRSLNLSTVAILFALSMGGVVWGVVGLFLCVPFLVAMNVILAKFPRTRWVAILLSEDGSVRE